MQKHFGFWTLTFLVIANMVGSGVFTTSGFALADLGAPQLVVLAWVFGGLIAISGAISYGMLIEAMPESGGEYVFLTRATHPLLGFVAGWVSLFAGFSGAIAFSASTLEAYVVPEATRPNWIPSNAIAIGVIILAGALHGLRVRLGAMTQNAIVSIKLALIAALLVVATSKWNTHPWQTNDMPVESSVWQIVAGLASSLVWISLSYSGFNAAVYVAEESTTARVTVPKALLVGTTIVTLIYLALNTCFVYSAPFDSLAGQADVAVISARNLGGTALASFVRWIIAFCLLTSIMSMLMAAPRVYAKMAADGILPAVVNFEGNSPWVATLAQVVVASSFVAVTKLQDLLTYLGLTLSLCAAGSVCCLFLPAVRKRSLLHATNVFPAFFIIATVTSACIKTLSEPKELLGTAVTFLVGAALYLVTVTSRALIQPRGNR